MSKRSQLVLMLLMLMISSALADEYTDTLRGVVYTYEKGSGVAKVKDGVYHAWDGRTRGSNYEKSCYNMNMDIFFNIKRLDAKHITLL